MLEVNGWHKFQLCDLFYFFRGKGVTTAEISENQGNIPCVQSGETNNGIIGYMDNSFIKDKKHTFVQSPFLSVARSGTSGCVNAHNKNSYIGDSAYALKLKEQTGINIYLFLATILNKERYRYRFGRKVSIETYIKKYIKLPADKTGNPDWDFMENYISSLIDYSKIETRIERKKLPLNDTKWKTFYLVDIFNIRMGNKFDLIDMTFNAPSVNFVNRSGSNNGVSKKVDLIDAIGPFPEGTITLALGGSICSAFLQNKPFYTGQNVAVLTSKQPLSKFQKLFLCTMIYNEKFKYIAFGRELNVHLKSFSMPLSATVDDEPDWQFMENYMKSLPYSDKI